MSLDPHPTARALRAMAEKRGVLPQNGTQAPRSTRQAPSTRPWHPYRSKWEAEYAKHLELLKAAGRIAGWWYEEHSFLIGVGAKYTPDFLVTYANPARSEWHEVKGYRREAAMVRIKAAALAHPDERFVLVTKRNGEWVHHTVGAT